MFPRIIFQTWKEKNIPVQYKEWVESWKEKNPGYEYRLYDDQDNDQFVKTEFPQYYSLYQSFPAEIYRCDLVRYLYLYKHGGIYADLDFECLRGFEKLLVEWSKKRILLGITTVKVQIPNALMISYPREKFWIELVEQIKQNTIHFDHRFSPARITGPEILRKHTSSYGDKKRIQILPFWYFYCIGPYDIHYYARDNLKRKGIPYTVKDIENTKKLIIKLKRIEALYKKSYAITYWTHSWKDWREYHVP